MRGQAGDKVGGDNIRKAVTELELQLTHLQQNIDIPEVNLAIHPIVKAVVVKAGACAATHPA